MTGKQAFTFTVFSPTAMKSVVEARAPGFERETGGRPVFDFAPSGRQAKRIADGEFADVVISTAGAIEDLAARGFIVAGSGAALVRSPIGAAVAAGGRRYAIGTPEGLRQAALDARAIAMSHPDHGAQSGAHMMRVFETLGIAGIVRDKAVFGMGGPANLIGKFLLRGEADLGFQQMSELIAVDGIDILGTLPAELQLFTTFSAGITTRSRNRAGAAQWIDWLRDPQTRPAIEAAGMLPPSAADSFAAPGPSFDTPRSRGATQDEGKLNQ
ncbi:MAG: substrate-binding domain-containing protein [Beijerinckiaceae bacterium]